MRVVEIEIDTKNGKFFQYPQEINERWIIANAPTGSGKTFATIKLIYEWIKQGKIKRAFIGVPTKPLSNEIYNKLRRFFTQEEVTREDSDAKIEGQSVGDFRKILNKKASVMTYEFLEQLLYKVKPENLEGTLIVIDEFHEVTKEDRSITLLSILTYIAKLIDQGTDMKVILATATFPDLETIAQWAEEWGDVLIIKTSKTNEIKRKFIKEYVTALTHNYNKILEIKAAKLLQVIKKLINEGKDDIFPMFVFVKHRKLSEKIAELFAKELGVETAPIHAHLPVAVKRQILNEMRKPEPRYKIVVGTNTISVGVNLSFNSVALLSLGPEGFVTPTEVIQTIGRAGRPEFGKDKAYIIAIFANEKEEKLMTDALMGRYEHIAIPRDPVALMLRLLSSGMSVEDWLKYSPLSHIYNDFNYDYLKKMIKNAKEILQLVGSINDEEFTEYGNVLKKHLVNTRNLVAVHAILQTELKNDLMDAISRVITAIPLNDRNGYSIVNAIEKYESRIGFFGGLLDVESLKEEIIICSENDCVLEQLKEKGVKPVDIVKLVATALTLNAYNKTTYLNPYDFLFSYKTDIEAVLLTNGPGTDGLLVASERVATIIYDLTEIEAYRRAVEIFRAARFAKNRLPSSEIRAKFLKFIIEKGIETKTYEQLKKALMLFIKENSVAGNGKFG